MLDLVSVVVKAGSPLFIGLGKVRRGVHYSRNHLPSWMVRGAVGAAILSEFCDFLEGKNREVTCSSCHKADGCLYNEFSRTNPVFSDATPIHEECGVAAVPAPSFAFKCKKCGWHGSLLDKFIDALKSGKELWRANIACPMMQEQRCGLVSLEPAEGWLCPKCGESVPVESLRVAMTAINRARGIAEEGMLFSIDTVRPGQRYAFTVLSPSSRLTDYLEKMKGGELRVGGAKSRGFGVTMVESVSRENLRDWLSRMVKSVKHAEYFCLECLSPAFKLVLDKGLKSTVLREEVVVEALRSYEDLLGRRVSAKADYLCSQGGTVSVSGWNLKYDQRRPVIHALSPGSVLYFRTSDMKDLAEPLLLLEVKGVGGFTHMGFGRFKLWMGGD